MCAVRVRGSSEIKRLSSSDRELSLLSAMEDTGVLSSGEWDGVEPDEEGAGPPQPVSPSSRESDIAPNARVMYFFFMLFHPFFFYIFLYIDVNTAVYHPFTAPTVMPLIK